MKGLKKISAFLLAVIMSASLMNVSLVSASAATNEPTKVFSTNDGINGVSTVSNHKGNSSTLPKFTRNTGNNTAVLDTSSVAGGAFTSGDFAKFFGGDKLAAESFTAANMETNVMYRKWAFKFETNFVSTRFGIRWGSSSWVSGTTADNDLFVVDAAGKLSFAGSNDTSIVYGENLVLGTKYTVEAVIDMRGTARMADFYVTADGGDRKYAGTLSIAGSPSADYEKLSFASFVYVYASTKSGTSTVIQNLKLTLSDVEGYLGSPVPLSAKAPIKAFSSNDGITGNYSSSWQKSTTLPKYTQNSGNNTFCLDTTAKLDADYVSGNKARLYYGDSLTSNVFTAENMEELEMYRKWTFKFETNLVSTDFGIRWGATNFNNSATGTVDRTLFNVGADGVISFKDKDNKVAFTYDEVIALGEEYTVEAVIDMRGNNSIADFYVTKGNGTRKYAGWAFTAGSNATDAQYTKLSFSSFVHTYAYKPGELTKTQATKVTLSNLEAYLGSPIPATAKGTVKVFSSDDDMKDFASSNLKGNNSTTPKFVKDATNKVATLTTQYGATYVAGDVERLFYGATPSVYFTADNMESNVMYRSWTFKFEDKFVRTRFGVRWGSTSWVTGETVDVELFEVGYDGILKFNGENDTGFEYDKKLELNKDYTVEVVIDMRGNARKAEFFLSEKGQIPTRMGETITTGGGLAATEKKAFASFVFAEAFVPNEPTVTQGTTITVSNIKAYLGSPITDMKLPDYTIGKVKTYMNSVENAPYANGKLEVKASVENNLSNPFDIVIVAALYSKANDALLDVDTGVYSVKKDEPVDIEASLDITDYKNTYVKVMLFDTMSNMKPYRTAKVIENTLEDDNITLYLVGDSLCQEYGEEDYPMQGWGYYLPDHLSSNVTVDNRARSGWSTKTFLESTDDTYSWNAIKGSMEAGDVVLIALGINDASINGVNKTTEEEYIANLETMIADIEAAGAEALFTTPTISGGAEGSESGWEYSLSNAWAARGEVCRQTAADNGYDCLPLGATLSELYEEMYNTYCKENPDATVAQARDYVRYYFHLYVSEIMKPLDEGGWGITYISKLPHKYYKWDAETGYTYINDTTHVNQRGAEKIAEVIANLIADSDSSLSSFVK